MQLSTLNYQAIIQSLERRHDIRGAVEQAVRLLRAVDQRLAKVNALAQVDSLRLSFAELHASCTVARTALLSVQSTLNEKLSGLRHDLTSLERDAYEFADSHLQRTTGLRTGDIMQTPSGNVFIDTVEIGGDMSALELCVTGRLVLKNGKPGKTKTHALFPLSSAHFAELAA